MNIKTIKTTRYVDEDDNGQEYRFLPVDDTVTRTDTKDGYEITYLSRDEHPNSPDEWQDDFAFLVHYHRDFWIEHRIMTKDVLGLWYQAVYYKMDGMDEPDETKDYWVFPVDAYIHRGVALRFAGGFQGRLPQGHERFDVSTVGAVLVKRKEFGSGGVEFEKTEDEAKTYAEAVLQEWNSYLQGDIYICVREKFDKDGEQVDMDCVCGFSGFEYAKECLANDF